MRLRFQSICLPGARVHISDPVYDSAKPTLTHSHDFHEFFLVRKGTLRHFINGTIVDMAAPSLCIILPGDEHGFAAFGGSEVHFTNVAFWPATWSEVLAFTGVASVRTDPRVPDVARDMDPRAWEELNRQIDAMREMERTNPSAAERMLKGTLVHIVNELLTRADRRPGSVPLSAPPWLRRAVLEMEKLENFQVGLRRFVELTGKSQEHATRCCAIATGETPTELINRYRVEAAARMLAETNFSVLRIMVEVGFNNASHFITVFRGRFGIAPREYRSRRRAAVTP